MHAKVYRWPMMLSIVKKRSEKLSGGKRLLKSQKDAITKGIAWQLFGFMLRTGGLFPFLRVQQDCSVGLF